MINRRKLKNKVQLVEVNETFIYVPLLQSLAQLFSNRRLANLLIKKPTFASTGIFYDICDGLMFQNDQFFHEHPDALQLIIFHDMVEVCNPLGSYSTKHKLDMFYYTLANLNPKLRSERCTVRLLGIVNATLVKKYGYAKILHPMINDIKKLEDGYLFNIQGQNRLVFGKVVCAAGDNKGQHEWGGFKVGIGFAYQKCRHCYCQFANMQEFFTKGNFNLRSKEDHAAQCEAIATAPSDLVKNELRTTFGVNHESPLCNLHGFDITIHLAQDIMHTVLEGVAQYETRYILSHFLDEGVFTLSQLNAAIINENYGYSELSSKPGPLRETVFHGDERYKLKYNAAQARLFVRLLPFLLSDLVPADDPFYELLVELIAIVQYIFSPVISTESVNLLKQLISEHLSSFKQRFPEVNITPKQHYLVHLPRLIKKMGLLVRHSCFGFESAHNYFKDLARKQNFKNLPKSLAERCQLNECSNFCDARENPSSHPIFTTYELPETQRVNDEFTVDLLRSLLDEQGLLPGVVLEQVFLVSNVSCCGTEFRINGVIIHVVNEIQMLPCFGSIKKIWVVSGFVYFQILPLQTLCFTEHYQAYQVDEFYAEQHSPVCPYESLVDFNVFHIHKGKDGQNYVPVKYDIDDIVQLHVVGCNPLKF